MLGYAACKVKPYELISKDEDKIENVDKNTENKEKNDERQYVIDNKEQLNAMMKREIKLILQRM